MGEGELNRYVHANEDDREAVGNKTTNRLTSQTLILLT